MRSQVAALSCAIAVGGCQATASPPDPADSSRNVAVHSGDVAVSVIATPFYVAFKSVLCVASLAAAAPVAGVAVLSESRFAPKVRRDLSESVSQNCGPPYVLSPYRVVSTAPRPAVREAPPQAQLPAPVPKEQSMQTLDQHSAAAAGGPTEFFVR